MNNNLDKIAKDLYGKIQVRFPNIKIGDGNAEVISKKSEIPLARFFEFEYTENGKSLGTVSITLDEDDGIVVKISGDLSEVNPSYNSAYKFIRSFRQFAKLRLLKFDVQNIGKSNLDKRDYQFQAKAKAKELTMMESKMFGTSRVSYQDLGEARLIVKHNKPINPKASASRSMNIECIYVENADGERFKYPIKHLHGARALAEHVKHGGNPYDSIGKHIVGLSEELKELQKFKGHVTRQAQLSEAMDSITGKVMERIQDVKKEVQNLQKSSYYEQFAESYQEQEERMIPEDVMNDWVDRLTVRTFNEDMKNVFPYLYKILDEGELPIKEITADDLLKEVSNTDYPAHPKQIKVLSPEKQFENFIESIVSEDRNEIIGPNRSSALKKLNDKLAYKLTGSDTGVLNLKGLIDDPRVVDVISGINYDDKDAEDVAIRDIIKDYILDHKINDLSELPNLSIAAPKMVGSSDNNQTINSSTQSLGEPQTGQPDISTMEPPDTPPSEPNQISESTKKLAKVIQMKEKFKNARTKGATIKTPFNESMTIGDAMKECGINPAECGYEDEVEATDENGFEQLCKIVAGFWNKDEKNFTIGGERAKIKVTKAFKDGDCPNASKDDLKQVLKLIELKDPSNEVPTQDMDVATTEHDDILQLAGIRSPNTNDDTRGENLLKQIIHMREDSIINESITQLQRNAGIL